MKVLLSSVPFAPMVGGIETVSGILAAELTKLGCEVVVVTQTPSKRPTSSDYRVLRRPDLRDLSQAVKWSDVVFHNNISLKVALPLLHHSRPWMIAHHTWLPRHGKGALAGSLKRMVSARAVNVAVSKAIALDLGRQCKIIPNPYDDDRFKLDSSSERTRDIVFVGRLVSDKGVDVLLRAVALLGARGLHPSVSIIGTGDDEARLHALASRLGIEAQVAFLGLVVDDNLVKQLNRHSLIVIPSIWEEPFGIVALEGIACGCIPVVAQSGGLPEAVGHCGVISKKGDPLDLSLKLESLLNEPSSLDQLRKGASEHLARHTKQAVARSYFQALTDTLGKAA